LGDRYQGVYEFMKADTRFLTLSNEIWTDAATAVTAATVVTAAATDATDGATATDVVTTVAPSRQARQFVYLTLQESYRVTKQIAWFINNVMIGHNRIISKKESNLRVEWYVGNIFEPHEFFKTDLLAGIKKGRIKPDDIFVLAASLKGLNSPAKKIENWFVKNKVPVYVPVSDEGKLDSDVTRGKVVFASLPSSKGRERSIVILLGFDQHYFEFYAKTSPRDVCPSTLYVASTRAKDRLILVSDCKAKPLEFLSHDVQGTTAFRKNVTYINDSNLLKEKEASDCEKKKFKTSAMDLVKFLKQESIEYLTPIVDSIFKITESSTHKTIPIPSKVKTVGGHGPHNMFEDVSHLNGLAIPAIWETKIAASNMATMYARIIFLSTKFPLVSNFFIQDAIKKIKVPCVTSADFLYLANVYLAITEGYHGLLAQIENYEWLDAMHVDMCIAILQDNVGTSKGIEFEVNIGSCVQTLYGLVEIRGCVDIISDECAWEVKCVDNLQLEHMLQLVIYFWLHNKCGGELDVAKRKFKLINIRTGEMRELDTSAEASFHIQNIMDCLITQKYKQDAKSCDPDFIEECLQARQHQVDQTTC
jgi:hypothetical protein